MSQEEAAENLNISARTLQGYERGEEQPGPENDQPDRILPQIPPQT